MDIFQRVPKWAWLMAGGIAITGTMIILMRRNQTSAAQEAALTEDPATASTTGYPGVIVPPVITGGANTDEPGLSGLSDLYMSGLQTLLTQQGDLLNQLMAQLANAGAAPQPSTQNPSP